MSYYKKLKNRFFLITINFKKIPILNDGYVGHVARILLAVICFLFSIYNLFVSLKKWKTLYKTISHIELLTLWNYLFHEDHNYNINYLHLGFKEFHMKDILIIRNIYFKIYLFVVQWHHFSLWKEEAKFFTGPNNWRKLKKKLNFFPLTFLAW